MHRDHAATYFGRWQLLLGDQLLKRINLATATHIGPEQFLGLVLEQARPPIRPRLQPYVAAPATLCRSACNPMWQRLQPYVKEPATLCEQARPPIRAGFFPNVAYLACCEAAHRLAGP